MEVIGFLLGLWFIFHLVKAFLGSTGETPLPLNDNQTTVPTKRKPYTSTAVWPPEGPEADMSEYMGEDHPNSNYTTYNDYIANSAVWQAKRAHRLEIDNYTCQSCYSKDHLHVHHITYKNLFNENVVKELITICKTCHKAIHKRCGKDAIDYPIK